jgi:hypothetical protein
MSPDQGSGDDDRYGSASGGPPNRLGELTVMSTIQSGAPRPNPLRAAERAYLEVLMTYGFDSSECAAAFVALRRVRQACCPASSIRRARQSERAA